jgi:hypothetical protein
MVFYMRRLLCMLAVVSVPIIAQAQAGDGFVTTFEKSAGKQSATHQESIDYFQSLDATYNAIKMEQIGNADGGYPLHIVYYDASQSFDPTKWRLEGKIVILINNGIHAGEPDGIDASMLLLRDAATGKLKVPANVVLAVVPVFNVGGAMNRNSYSRANQNGPVEYGFRGNGQNLDLNRDFMKCDAMETQSLQRLFTKIDPEIFVDNHVSDGADYQHVMTLLPTQHHKLGGSLGSLLYSSFTPAIYKAMAARGYELVPYVNNFDNTPENGWTAFYEPPRFASGYAALYQCIGYVVETHMLKPYVDRVKATKAIMECIITLAAARAKDIQQARNSDRQTLLAATTLPIEWKVDTTQKDKVVFKGYQSGYKASAVSGLPRLYYDRSKPFTKTVPYLDHYKPSQEVTVPLAYIVPRGWTAVIRRLRENGVNLQLLSADTSIMVTSTYIADYVTSSKPYEKHYVHRDIKVTKKEGYVGFKKGDYMILTSQRAKRYLVEALEPTAPDGFFAWNFFDGILVQKEGFGDYVFEDLAAELLADDAELKALLIAKQKEDTAFAKNAGAQLDFVYRHSKYMEPGYMRVPVFRIER